MKQRTVRVNIHQSSKPITWSINAVRSLSWSQQAKASSAFLCFAGLFADVRYLGFCCSREIRPFHMFSRKSMDRMNPNLLIIWRLYKGLCEAPALCQACWLRCISLYKRCHCINNFFLCHVKGSRYSVWTGFFVFLSHCKKNSNVFWMCLFSSSLGKSQWPLLSSGCDNVSFSPSWWSHLVNYPSGVFDYCQVLEVLWLLWSAFPLHVLFHCKWCSSVRWKHFGRFLLMVEVVSACNPAILAHPK